MGIKNEDQEIRLNQFLSERGISVDLLSKRDYEQLVRVDNSIQEILEERKKAKAIIKKAIVGIKPVARRAGLSNATVQNKPLLKEYVNSFSRKADNVEAVDNLKKENARLKEEIDMLISNALDYELLKRENEQLEKALAIREAALKEKYREKKGKKSDKASSDTTNEDVTLVALDKTREN